MALPGAAQREQRHGRRGRSWPLTSMAWCAPSCQSSRDLTLICKRNTQGEQHKVTPPDGAKPLGAWGLWWWSTARKRACPAAGHTRAAGGGGVGRGSQGPRASLAKCMDSAPCPDQTRAAGSWGSGEGARATRLAGKVHGLGERVARGQRLAANVALLAGHGADVGEEPDHVVLRRAAALRLEVEHAVQARHHGQVAPCEGRARSTAKHTQCGVSNAVQVRHHRAGTALRGLRGPHRTRHRVQCATLAGLCDAASERC